MLFSWQNNNLFAAQVPQTSIHILQQVIIVPLSNGKLVKLPVSLFVKHCWALLHLEILEESTLSCSQTGHLRALRHALVRVASPLLRLRQ